MNLPYYRLPLALDKVMRQKELPACSLRQSVAQHLHLMATTAFGELYADERFGCSIWDYDFDNTAGGNKTRELIRQSLQAAVHQYEKRLGNVRVDVWLGQGEQAAKATGPQVKKLIRITVSGTLTATDEPFTHQDLFYAGPLSY